MNEKLLNLILEISRRMIEAGAEIHRVEESLERLCLAYDVTRVDVYATTFNVIVSVENGDGSLLTHTCRIKQTGTDIERLHRLNDLVRRICKTTPTCEEIRMELDRACAAKRYSPWIIVLFYGVIAAAFCLFFGGHSLSEVATALIIGLIVGLLHKGCEHFGFNRLFARFLCSFTACLAAFLAQKTGLISSVDRVIIGNIMTLIPGIGLTNSLRDLFTGDSITGILRSIEAILLALAIACGYILTALMFGGAL